MNFRKSLAVHAFLIIPLLVLGASITTDAKAAGNGDGGGGFSVYGPGLHLAGGFRMMKAPDLDTFDSGTAGIKLSPISLGFGPHVYVSLLTPGISWVGGNKAALTFSPVIINHASGVGLGIDFYTVSDQSTGGPFGLSLNLDIIGLSRFVSSLTRG